MRARTTTPQCGPTSDRTRWLPCFFHEIRHQRHTTTRCCSSPWRPVARRHGDSTSPGHEQKTVALGSEAGLGPHLPPVGGRHLPQPQWRHSPASSLSHRKREGGRNSRWEESGRGRERRRVWRCGPAQWKSETRTSHRFFWVGANAGWVGGPDAGIGEWVWRGQETKKRLHFFLLETLSILQFYGSSTISTPQSIDRWVRCEV